MITINKKVDNVTFYDLISANQSEINNILDNAIQDLTEDTKSEYKDPYAPRKLKIELQLTYRSREQLKIDWKIIPQPAPFDRTPTSDAPEGQFTISDYETGEIHE